MRKKRELSPAELLEAMTGGELADEFGRLKAARDSRDALYRSDTAREKLVKDRLLSLCADVEPAEFKQFDGAEYLVTVSARRKEKTILLRKLFNLIGVAKFIALCSFTIEALKKAVPFPEEQEMYYKEEQTGFRTVDAVRKAT